MRYLLFFVFLLPFIPSSAQIIVNKVDVNDRPLQYIEVWEKFNKDNGKVFALLDYGQQDDLNDKEGMHLFVTNKEGQKLQFNSVVDALNFLYRNGWEVLHVKNTDGIQSYILRKRTDWLAQNDKTSPDTSTSTTQNTTTRKKAKTTQNTAQEELVTNEENTETEEEPIVEVTRVVKKKKTKDTTKE